MALLESGLYGITPHWGITPPSSNLTFSTPAQIARNFLAQSWQVYTIFLLGRLD